ncbi:MAG: cytochrome b N-terminal domain-containing protein [Planctomycetes bacterium]|nr:cytochrome b N-terminal domain-containing protein [Planctomycetota bacterium]
MPARAHGMFQTFWQILRAPVPRAHRTELLLGLGIVLLFLLQAATGVLLALFYQASPPTVAESVQLIMRDVDWGWLVRGLHHWSASALLLVCTVQIAWLLASGRYRGRSASSWYLGLLALGLAMLLAYSGELLVWDDRAFWRITHALQQVESAPLVGRWLAHVLRGGEEVDATTLGRVFTLHSLVLPWVLGFVVAGEAWFLARRMRANAGGVA